MKRGDHIVVDRGLYQHHGIYCGNNRVIHYSGLADGLESGPVVVTGLKAFCKDSEYRVLPAANRKFDVESTIKRARSRLGEDRYNLLTNNCEHFVNWCIYGTAESSQVFRVTDTIASVTGNQLVKAVSSLVTLAGTFEPSRLKIMEEIESKWENLFVEWI